MSQKQIPLPPWVKVALTKALITVNHYENIYCLVNIALLSSDGAGNQCCYDEEGTLLYTQDQPEGSHADRAHVWGTAPYGVPYKVPVLSHYIHDILPYHYCCQWTNNLMETW